METAKNYHQYLIESLKNPTEAAAYLWAILQEENPEPQLLKVALENILEALGETQLSHHEIELQKHKIIELLNQSGSDFIYSLADLLRKLGLELTVTVSQESSINQEISEHDLKAVI